MKARRTALTLLFAAALAAFVLLLWDVQAVRGADFAAQAARSLVETEPIPAARGRLLDRKGRVLARDRTVWTLTVSDRVGEETRTRLAALCREAGVSWEGGRAALSDVPAALAARVKGEALAGVTVLPAAVRESGGVLAPHLLGRVGRMSPGEWAVYQKKGYALDSLVGKDGAEAAFEDLLRGVPGLSRTERDRSGRVLRSVCVRPPRPGRDVKLTLDRDLQRAARQALTAFLADHPAAVGAAAAVLDLSDGGVLALVSLPDYDPARLSRDYAALSADPAHPLMDRAIQGLYAPGSVFKLVTAAAALEEGAITPGTRILDTGKYTYYATPQPQCWLYRQQGRTHGLETVDQAIADSCNVFFYDAGRRVGAAALERYARALGLGQPTGIELAGEQAGAVAGPAYAARAGLPWYEGSVLSAAIGQENHRCTPLQLARLTAALVGEDHPVHLRLDAPPRPAAPGLTLDPANAAAIRKGMLAVTEEGSLAGAFSRLPWQAGAKTGSAQVAGARQANAVLVAFAPFEAPRVALALVAEQGGSGAALGPAAAEILSAWARTGA